MKIKKESREGFTTPAFVSVHQLLIFCQ